MGVYEYLFGILKKKKLSVCACVCVHSMQVCVHSVYVCKGCTVCVIVGTCAPQLMSRELRGQVCRALIS